MEEGCFFFSFLIKLFIIKKEREKKRGVLYAIDTGRGGGGGKRGGHGSP